MSTVHVLERRQHPHSFESSGDHAVVSDHVRYALPLPLLGELAHAMFVRRDLDRIFDHRQAVIARRLGPTRARA